MLQFYAINLQDEAQSLVLSKLLQRYEAWTRSSLLSCVSLEPWRCSVLNHILFMKMELSRHAKMRIIRQGEHFLSAYSWIISTHFSLGHTRSSCVSLK